MTVAEIASPASLAERLAAREESALEELYERYGRTAYSLALRVLGEAALAEDAVERAFLTAWRSTKQVGRAMEAGWLLAIVHREAVAIARSKPHRPRSSADLDSPLLAALPPAERETLELVYFGAMKEAEVAQALGVPREEVRARMARALAHLRAPQAASR
jgi:DNA-directed RNA polymerase specialized sigma24 family protein